MNSRKYPDAASQIEKNVPDSWTRARLIEPTTAGFVHVGASSGSWRFPIVLPRSNRRAILARMQACARTLREDTRAVRADVFKAIVRPPGQPSHGAGQDVPDADFDAVLLVETNLYAWQYTAGWFQDQTGLTNSTVIQPVDPESVPYRLVNHCRWDRLRDVVPALLFKRSFGDFVLRVFADNGVTPRPILYKLRSR